MRRSTSFVGAACCAIVTLHVAAGFTVLHSPRGNAAVIPAGTGAPLTPTPASPAVARTHGRFWTPSTRLYMAVDTENDPFAILGLDEPTADVKVIKRAYKRMALKYHPDVATNKDSTPEEKRAASDRFAKINWAYETLSGKRQGDSTYSSGSSSSTRSSSGASSGWTPPHRRSGGYASSGNGSSSGNYRSSSSWEDYMPKYDESEYDADGDSFGAIFRDLFAGAAATGMGGAASAGGIFRDFVEFLENNVDGYTGGGPTSSSSAGMDNDLRVLLQTGSIDEVAEEMDDTQLVIDQLQTKANKIDEEIVMLTAEVRLTARYMERIEMEERLAELEARKDIVKGYIKKSQSRLLKLQTRYKELITYGGQNDYYAGGGGSSSSSRNSRSRTTSSYNAGSRSTSSGATGGPSYGSANSASSSRSRTTGSTAATDGGGDDDSWKSESFGSSGRRRGSGRGSARRRRTASTNEPSGRPRDTAGSGSASSSYRSASSSSSYRPPRSGPSSTSNSQTSSSVPPHRRRSSYESQMEDKRRLRQLKVDEEFDKLKKDLGM